MASAASRSDLGLRGQKPGGAGPASPAQVSRYATRDVDEQAALLRGWNQTYSQLSSGSFSGHLMETEVEGLLFFREITSKSLHQTGMPGMDQVAIGVPLQHHGAATFCGRRCDGSQLHVFSGGDAFEFYSPGGLDILGIAVPRNALMASCTAREQAFLEKSLILPHLRTVSPERVLRLRALFSSVLQAIEATPALTAAASSAAVMLDDILTNVRDALTADLSAEVVITPPEKCGQIVRDARRAIEDAAENTLPIDDLCATLGVSRRTLQYCFQESLGVSPAYYQRAVRLNGARRSLKAGETVTDAATRWGFWHFGRFSQDYRALFGELPSATARRAGSPGAGSGSGHSSQAHDDPRRRPRD